MATKVKGKKKIDQKRERGGKQPKYYEVFARKDSDFGPVPCGIGRGPE